MIWPSRSKSNTYSPRPAFFAPGVRAASRFMRVSSDPVPRAADDALDADDLGVLEHRQAVREVGDRKSTRLNSSHLVISYAVFCLKKKNRNDRNQHRHPL